MRELLCVPDAGFTPASRSAAPVKKLREKHKKCNITLLFGAAHHENNQK